MFFCFTWHKCLISDGNIVEVYVPEKIVNLCSAAIRMDGSGNLSFVYLLVCFVCPKVIPPP